MNAYESQSLGNRVAVEVTPEMMTFISKVPAVTLVFWIIKVLCTTLGETGGDAVTMSFLGETTPEATGSGYLIGTAVFGVIFIIAVAWQINASKFIHSFTGLRSSPQRRSARHWPIILRARTASATRSARRFCWHV